MDYIICILIGYFLCCINPSYIIGKLRGVNLKKSGSGNAGASNALIHFGKIIGVACALFDIMKAFAAVKICEAMFPTTDYIYAVTSVAAILGHIFPFYLKFKGGKGIATMMGLFFASNPFSTLIVLICAFIIWAIFEYGSVVSFLCVTALTVIEGIRARMSFNLVDRQIICIILFAIFIFTWYAHRKNIERLLLGKESKARVRKKVKEKLNQKAN